jgi:RND superfamily putative drug exporter
MFHRFFDRAATAIIRYRIWILAFWAVLAVAAFPFAQKLTQALSAVEGNRWVPGSESKMTDQVLKTAFPDPSSKRRTATVITGADALSDPMKRLYLRYERTLERETASGTVASYVTPLTIFRDVTVKRLQNARDRFSQRLAEVKALAGRLRQTGGGAAGEANGSPQHPALSPEQQELLKSIARLGEQPDDAALKELLIGVTVRELKMSEDQTWLLRQLVALGDAPTDAAYRELAGRAIERFPLSSFPVTIPEEIQHRLISPDRSTAVVLVTFPETGLFQPQLTAARDLAKRMIAADPALKVQHFTTSEKAIGRDMTIRLAQDTKRMELAAVTLIMVVLLIFFRSPLATGMTLVTIVLAMFVGKALLFGLLQSGLSISAITTPVMTFVMLGAGVDYSMILSERFMQERSAGRGKEEALHTALARAGEAVFLSGLTVLIAFGATTLSRMDFVRGLGFGGIAAILTVLLAALTLTPALLSFLGDKFFWPTNPVATVTRETWFSRYLRASLRLTVRNPVRITVLFSLLIVPAALVMLTYQPVSHPLALTPPSEAKAGYELYASKWGPSYLMPTSIAVRLPEDQVSGDTLSPKSMEALTKLAGQLRAAEGVHRVATLTQPFGKVLAPDEFRDVPQFVKDEFLNPKLRVLRISVLLSDEPISVAGNATVDRIRQTLNAAVWPGARFMLGGSTLVDREYREALMADFYHMVLFITAGVFILLMVQLRSLIMPVRLILTIILGNVVALAVLVIIFQWLRGVGITLDVPIMLLVLMMGLGLDYEIFLVTRVKELVDQGMPDQQAIETAVLKTGRVINFAGVLMAGTLGSMILASTLALQAYAVALGVAVLLDATVLRTYLVPATMLLLKEYNWWLPFTKGGTRGRGASLNTVPGE